MSTPAETFAQAMQEMTAVQREMAHLIHQLAGPSISTATWDKRFADAKQVACSSVVELESAARGNWDRL